MIVPAINLHFYGVSPLAMFDYQWESVNIGYIPLCPHKITTKNPKITMQSIQTEGPMGESQEITQNQMKSPQQSD